MKISSSIFLPFSIFILGIVSLQAYNIHIQRNKFDNLSNLAKQIQEKIAHDDEFLFYSNNDDLELYYRTQFAFVPNIIVKEAPQNFQTPYALILIDSKIETPDSLQDLLKKGKLIYQAADSLYSLRLISLRK